MPWRGLLPQPEQATTSRDLVDTIAADLYDAVASGEDIQGQIAEIFKVFGVPVLGAGEDQAAFRRMVDAGEPVVLDVQLEAMEQGFARNATITLDSYLADAGERGITAADPPGPLTRPYLTGKLAALAAKDELDPPEVLPALVLALGRERARRCEDGITDPTWGDDLLDPLQLALISYDITFSSSPQVGAVVLPARWTAAAPTLSGTVGNSVLSGCVIASAGASAVEDVTCESLTLYSYFMQLDADPDHIYLRQSAPDRPSESQATAYLAFERPEGWPDFVIEFCGLPKSGPVSQMEVVWSIKGQLPEYGELIDQGAATGQNGTALARYQVTEEETVPRPLQIGPSQIAAGTVEVEASGTLLTSSAWHRRLIVEPAIYKTLFRPSESDRTWLDKKTITIEFYRDPTLELEFDHQFRIGESGHSIGVRITGLLPVSWRSEGEETVLDGEGTVSFEVSDVNAVGRIEDDKDIRCWDIAPMTGEVAVRVQGKAVQTGDETAELHLTLHEHRYRTWGGGQLMCEDGDSAPWYPPGSTEYAFDLVFPVRNGHTVDMAASGPFESGFLSWTLRVRAH